LTVRCQKPVSGDVLDEKAVGPQRQKMVRMGDLSMTVLRALQLLAAVTSSSSFRDAAKRRARNP
jgi:hypothetical protein